MNDEAVNPTAPFISFVVATMNRSHDLRACLDSILAQSYENFEAVVVDNASSDNTVEMVKSDYPSVRLVELPENLGAGGGKGAGLKAARGRFIIQLDDDETFPEDNVATSVIEYFDRYPLVGVLSFNILDAETGITARNTIPRRDKKLLNEDTPCGYFLGGGCAFRREVVDKVGIYWDVLNPYGSEEFDLSLRILEQGYGILWARDIKIIHFESPTARPTGRRTYAETRNRPLVALRNLPWFYCLTHLVSWWGYGAVLAFRSRTWSSYFRGIKDCILAFRKVLRVRAVVSSRVVEIIRETSGPLYY